MDIFYTNLFLAAVALYLFFVGIIATTGRDAVGVFVMKVIPFSLSALAVFALGSNLGYIVRIG